MRRVTKVQLTSCAMDRLMAHSSSSGQAGTIRLKMENMWAVSAATMGTTNLPE